MAGNARGRLLRPVASRTHRSEPLDALATLAKAAVTGNRAAVRSFLVTVGPHLLGAVRRVLGAQHPAVDDVTQESAFALVAALPRHRAESTVLHLVCRVAVLTAMNARRRDAAQKRHSRLEHDLEDEPLIDSSPVPDAPLSAQESAEAEEVRVLHDVELAFDAEASVLAGDEERIERIARRVLKSTPRIRISPRLRQAAQSAALGALIAGVAIAAIELSRWHPRAGRGVAPPGSLRRQPTPRAASSSFAHDQRLVPVAPEAEQGEAPPSNPALTPLRHNAAAAAREDAENTPKFKSASELFADANQARMRGDAPAAIAISQQLEETFPNSPEGITTHLSLGVLYSQQGQPALALQEFKIYRHIGDSAMMAEALWGEEQALQQLGRTSEERAALEELLQSYPRSAYAAAAEKRLAALNN